MSDTENHPRQRARLVLLRHGESQWNREQRFTGWADVDLTEDGERQMRVAARAMSEAGLKFDIAFTSVLTRCIRSLWITLDMMDCMWVPQTLDWRLNERHYGGLTGRSKDEARQTFGDVAVQEWRRSFRAAPPPVDEAAARFIPVDGRYMRLDARQIPRTESLADTAARVGQLWKQLVTPVLLAGQRVLVVGHGNSLRALSKILEGISDEDVARLEIGNGVPVVYELDGHLRPISKTALQVPEWPQSLIL